MKTVYFISYDKVYEAKLVRETPSFYIFAKRGGGEEREGKRSNGNANWKGQLFDTASDAIAALVARKEKELESLLDRLPVLRGEIKKLSEALLAQCQKEQESEGV